MQITIKANGLQELIERLESAKAAVKPAVQDALRQEGERMVDNLQSACPVGINAGPPPPGDAPGRLTDSIHLTENPGSINSSVEIRTNQPVKMKFVREGRGVVLPKVKKALYWKGLDHPVRRAGPSKANDFVSPITSNPSDAKTVLAPAIAKLTSLLEL